ncbi:DUF805 domain-containing protein [Shinella sp. AETb1-6]|uniref:DUF805 domain-containing protein n=1 Tax=Shinella sp. AETb1-6 TaxID=2692210 RepID=UPI00136F1B42|nr:DUF805 domain-containing protein [Shinella sp. AETb1-6]MXN50456.1 DUF805 domain-containing protein [Shinella sp. AETb1-6]
MAVEEQRPRLAWLFFGWSGRLSRAPHALGWAFWLTVLSASFTRVLAVPEDHPSFVPWVLIFLALAVVSTISSLMLSVKRVHDMNLPAPLILCLFVPALSFFALFVFLVWPGTQGPNDYGRLPDRPMD